MFVGGPLCPIVYQQATEYYIQARLEDDGFVKAGETQAGCALEGFKRGLETTGTIELKAYTSLLQTGLCLTAQDKCIGEGYWTQFGYGATNALLQELDVAAMAEGILIIVGVGLKNQFECIKKGGTVYLLVTANSYEEAIHTISQCLLGVDMTLPEWKALYAKVSRYAEKNWKEPYLHGQAVVFVASLAIPITKFSLASKFGKFSKAKLLNKLKANPTFANQVDDLTAISKAADEGKDVGKVVDDILAKGGGNVWDDIVVQGRKGITEALSSQYKTIDDFLASTEYAQKVSSDFVKYQTNGGLADLASYTTKHKVITQNRMTGKIAEDVFKTFESGIKPRKAIQTSDGARYVDNLLDGTAREIKSGKITLNGSDFQRQVKKDLEIIKRQLSADVDKIEWHALDGIDDNALQFIRTEMTNQGVSPDLFKVVIY